MNPFIKTNVLPFRVFLDERRPFIFDYPRKILEIGPIPTTIEIACTMAEFLTTRGTSHNIEDIIINAKSKLFLVSPFLKFSKTFYERLKDASARGVHINILYGKVELNSEQQVLIAGLKNVQTYYFEHLHAKCYFNETKMVITSMNMYEFSERNNREMGVLIDCNTDNKVFEDARRETLSIIQSSELIILHESNQRGTSRKKAKTANQNQAPQSKRGYCIRCEAPIAYNPDKPYCAECYAIWAEYENENYVENVCHRCGENVDTTMDMPQCRHCYSKWQKELSRS